MTVREIYEKAQNVEASVEHLIKLEEFLKYSYPDEYADFAQTIHKAEFFLQEYADKLYSIHN